MRDWGLQRRLLGALVLVGAVVLSLVASAAVAFLGVREQQHQVVDGYFEAMTLSTERFVALVDAETAIRGYALTGDPATLGPARTLDGQDAEADERLRQLLARDPDALAALDRASRSASRWWEEWARPTTAAIDEGGRAAVTTVDVDRGRVLFNQLRADYGAYVDTLTERRERAVAELDRRTTMLFVLVVVVAVTALVGILLLGWLLRRWVTGPVSELAGETHVVRGGQLDHRVSVNGPPEIARLGQDVDAMRRHLLQEVGVARAAGAELSRAHQILAEQAADLERSNRELEQFAYVASHDLQEPLRKVASFCQLLQRRYSGQLDERGEQYIEFAVDGAKRMQQLINDLLNFSRVGRLTAPRTDVDLDDCLDRALRDLDAAIEDSGAVVTRDELPVVVGEGPLLTQVLANLVGNALKFHGEKPPRVHVGARRDGDVWQLWCSDNGIGIEPQYADRVFAIFQRLHPKDVYAGTGIGLAICKKIVEYHGGTIWVETHATSEVAGTGDGPGTTIRWTLPVLTAADPVRHDDPGPPLEAATTTSTGSGGPHVG